MKTRILTIAALALAVAGRSVAAQQSGGEVGSMWRGAAPKPAAAPAARPAPRPAAAPAAAPAPVRDSAAVRVAELEQLIKAQAETIAALQTRMAELAAAARAPAASPTAITAVSARVDSLQAAQRAATQRLAGIGNFRFSGDLRVRYENQAQDGGFITRRRERSRARLGISGNVSDAVSGAVSLATGGLDDVQSANQTQTGFFSRKTIGFDRFYLTWKPGKPAGVSVVAGKFAYPWIRTSLTLGSDINPEGIAATYASKPVGRLENVTLVGFMLPLLEVSGGDDSYIAGGQIQARVKVSKRLTVRASGALVTFGEVDAIAQSVGTGALKPANANTNRVVTDSTGKILGYTADYSYTDLIAGFDYAFSPRWPVSAQVNWVRNSHAAAGEQDGLWAEVRAGRLSQPKDIQASWSVFRIERDAVIGALNEQDLRAATNVLNHKVTLAYQWRANATVNIGWWYGRLLKPSDTGKLTPPDFRTPCTTAPFTGCRDPWLTRVQLDVNYKI